jgi:hypothetical protein
MKLSFDTVDTLLNAVKDRICHEVYIGVIPYHTEEELKLKGIDKATYLQEFLINYENDIKELWPSLEPHMKEYCKLWEEPVVKSASELNRMLQKLAKEESDASSESVQVFDNKEQFERFAKKGKDGLN